VFFTPQPVVSYIVRSVHELLQTEFGLDDGLADTTTWGEMVKRNKDLKIPDGAKPGDPFVLILDPATGTATFLVEVIEVIFTHLEKKWTDRGKKSVEISKLWNEYVPKNLLPRLYGYELMMAPYTIAHMKLALKLQEINARLGQPGFQFMYSDRAHIYLTNSLEPAGNDKQEVLEGTFPALAHEAAAVNRVKKNKRFTVVVGNPPYSVSSWNTSEWITTLVEDYKRTVRSEESQIQALSNDYIKFLRFGQWVIDHAGLGVLGMITGHGYLQGSQPRDLRRALIRTFDRSFCLDLHGSIRRSGTDATDDAPVFQIMTGVAIFVGFKNRTHAPDDLTLGATTQTSLVGPLSKKLDVLSTTTVRTLNRLPRWHQPTAPHFRFAPPVTSESVVAEYQGFCDLPACFGTGDRQADKERYWATGFASQQDDLAMSFTLDELAEKMTALAQSRSSAELRREYRLCTTDQWNYSEARDFARRGMWRPHVGQVMYRPFDRRWSVLHKHVLTIPRKQVMSQLKGSDQGIGLISSRAVNDLTFAHCFVTDGPVDKIFISSKTSTNAYVFPLYFEAEDMYGKQRRPNFSRTFIDELVRRLGIEERDKATGLPSGIDAVSILQYLYAVIHSPSYRSRYAEFLKIDFPRLPLTGHLELFQALAQLGSELIALHLLESPKLDSPVTEFVGGRTPEVEKISWSKNTVWVDKARSIGFKGVREDVWNFHVGGYQVCEKWLKDRKGRKLSKADIAHYQKIVVALAETLRLMKKIDEVIEAHGGWPGAFQLGVEPRVKSPALAKAAETSPRYGAGKGRKKGAP
jgi:predicted helicase